MANKPGVYTNVTYYRPWIFDKMREAITKGDVLVGENVIDDD